MSEQSPEALERIAAMKPHEEWAYDDNGYTTGASSTCPTCEEAIEIATRALAARTPEEER